jgi:hypothetical protein
MQRAWYIYALLALQLHQLMERQLLYQRNLEQKIR